MTAKKEQQTICKMDGLGEVLFIKSNTSKYLRISMKPFQGIRVTIPVFVSLDSARHFVEEKKTWIIRHAAKMADKEKGTTVFKPDTIFKTRDHALYLHTHLEKVIKIIVKSGGIHIFYPSFAAIEDPRIQRAIRKGITEAWRVEAVKYLPQRVKELAQVHGFLVNKISCQKQQNTVGKLFKRQ